MGRLLLSAALAALLAGCSVGVEGAPCQTDANCPDGQACEYAGRCSKAATACGSICHQDACGLAGPRACVPDANQVCASLANEVPCLSPASCGVVGGNAACLSVSIDKPSAFTLVGTSQEVSATLNFSSGSIAPPAAILLSGGGASVTLPRTGQGSQSATYAGFYNPASGVESDVVLHVTVPSVPPLDSPPLTVQVDTKAPVISQPTASCPQSPCLRDDVLTVTATVTDGGPTTASVSLDLDGYSISGPMTAGTAQLALGTWPFAALARDVVARVDATDAALNQATPRFVTIPGVTRLRTALDSGTVAPATSPAIDASGTAIFGTATSTGQLHGIQPDGTPAWTPTTLEVTAGMGMSIVAAPSLGTVDLFVSGEDGRIYRVLPTGALPISTPRWPSSTSFVTFPPASLFTPVIGLAPGVDHAYSAGTGGNLYQFYSDETVGTSALAEAARAAGVVSGGTPIFVTSSGSAATLRRFTDVAGAPAPIDSLPLTDGGTPAVACDQVTVPLAADGAGNVIAACDNGQVHRVTTGATLGDQLLFSLPPGVKPSGSPIVARDGDVLLPASDGRLWKITPAGATATGAWPVSIAAAAGEVPTGVAGLSPVAAVGGADFLVTTTQGRVVAVDLVGTVRWSGALPGSPGALGFPAIAPVPPGGSAYALPTLVAGSASGKLVRVIVDGSLDAAAPWPKAHHDQRNTGNHAAPLP